MGKLFLLLLSAGKLSKVAFSGGSMLLSLGVYGLMFGWRYATGFVGLLLLHELGHLVAARQRGLATSLPMFIPFVGAWIALKDTPMSVETEAHVGLGGPLLGSLGAVAVYLMARDDAGPSWLLAVAYAGFMLNLFNLIPLSPFDGGRITAVLSPRIWLLGVPVLVALFVYRPSPMLLLVAILAAPQVLKAWRWRADSPEGRTYYAVSAQVKWEYGLVYIGLVGYLAHMSHEVHAMLAASRMLHGM